MSTAIDSPLITLEHGTGRGADGATIPQLGLGTYKVDPAEARRVVVEGLDVGYRHVDTAQMYGNEHGVGAALAESGVERADLWVTSKLNNPNHRRDDALASFERTMDDLRLDVLDLFLVHWPLAESEGIDLVDTWRTMIEILGTGRVRAIGVSNFQAGHLRRIIDATGVVPAVNQVELHPYLQQRELRAAHDELGIVTESWSPLGRGHLLTDPVLGEVAAEAGATPAQVVIAWHLAHGLVVIPKSTHRDRLAENAEALSVRLTEEQLTRLDGLERGRRFGSHPDRVQL
ncbi:oxidoreductase [Actinomyces radicidentis]|uniref:Oxidoreductase n=1 Tax=Actinomyces radicidentis TaxID=111015 RepID=A0A0X8JEE9_ACTRD|nr:aldo/keto reductase [Actinomyces radicidentis]AMD87012.1 oxidoreductase [Actinomyces radicidentis]